jgi:hypothetical protein
MTFDLSTPDNREAFKQAIIVSDQNAIKYVAELATNLGVHRAYDLTSPGLFVQRNDREEGGTIVGICGGRRFLINDTRMVHLVQDWQGLNSPDVSMHDVGRSERALAMLILLSDASSTRGFGSTYGVWEIRIGSDFIVQYLKLQEENALLKTRVNRSIAIEGRARAVVTAQMLVGDACDGDEGHRAVACAERERDKAIGELSKQLNDYGLSSSSA